MLEYDPIYRGHSEWRILPPIDHPAEPARCLVSGTGLTHLGSARNRQSMHASTEAELTDSMKMFRWGIEGGRPAPGHIGTPPEWFYKGTGTILRATRRTRSTFRLTPDDGGEEAEIAGIYLIAPDGQPRRIGMAGGNEFSDHVFEKTNYLNLAGSKLRTCALGPELVVDPDFESVPVEVKIERAGNAALVERHSAPARPRCATAWQISSIIISSTKLIAAREMSTFIFSEPTPEFQRRHPLAGRRRDAGRHSKASAGPCAIRCTSPDRSRPLISVNSVWGEYNVKTACGNYRTGNHGRRDGGTPALRGFSSRCLQPESGQVCAFRAAPARPSLASPREAASQADIIISMVSDDIASRGVWLGENGALAGALSRIGAD